MEQEPLTNLAGCAGCAAKIPGEKLDEILAEIPGSRDKKLLLGGGPDDAGVYQYSEDNVIVQSVDFFTPIVDDPADFGRISAVNAISDIYAMGARPRLALNILGLPLEKVGRQRLETILDSAARACEEVNTLLTGGHSIKSAEPFFGLAVTGFAGTETWLKNGLCSAGEKIILTKPLGTGIATTAYQQGKLSASELEPAKRWMKTFNSIGAELAEKKLITSLTDVTGFGLLRHLKELLGENYGAKIWFDRVSLLPNTYELAAAGYLPGGSRSNWEEAKQWTEIKTSEPLQPQILADAQTSGGLLLTVPPENIEQVTELLENQDLKTNIIGEITSGNKITVEA